MAKKEEIEEPKFTPYPIKEGDRFDTVAQKAYGDSTYVHTLIMDNPHLQTKVLLPAGERMWVRIKTDPETGALLPPWFVDDEESGTGEGGDVVIPPITDGGLIPLAFAAGYPKAAGNKIHFAINKSGYFAYSVELSTGEGEIVSSPTYLFTENIAVITREINESGLYVVRVGSLVSGNIPIYGAGDLAFVRMPEVTKGVEFYQLKYSVNKNGIYPTKIIDLGTGLPVYSADITYASGTDVTIPVQNAGAYELQVGDMLKSDFEASEGGSGAVPAWLLDAGYRYDVNTHDFTLNLGSPSDLEVSVLASVGVNPSGIDQDSNPWNSTTYNLGKGDYVAAPYTERFSFNPSIAGSGGVSPGVTYKILIRRSSEKADIYTLYFTAPLASTPPGSLAVIDLETSGNTCTLGPNITSVIEIDKDSAEWTQEASGVKSVIWRIKDTSDSSIARSGTVTIINENGQSVFNPSNQPKVSYSELPEGDYLFEIEGGNCSSDVSSHAFSVTGTGGGTTCERRPTISGALKSATKNRISWAFDGAGIYSLKWWVDDTSGSRLRSGTVNILTGGVSSGTPVFTPGNTPFVTFPDLPDGTYKFGIRGGNCDSTPDEVNFTVSSGGGTLPPSTEVGLLLAEAGGKKFRWIDDKDVRLTITTDAKTKIAAPLTRPSWNGQRTCNLWMLNDWFKFVKVDAKNALLGTGESLPNGSYHWVFYYINPNQNGQTVTNFAQLNSGINQWLTFGDPVQHEFNSSQISHIYLEVIGNKPTQIDSSIVRVWKPDSVQGCSWIGQFQYTEETINLPGLKWLGMSKRQWEPSLEHLFTQISGIQWEYADVNWIQPYDKGWSNMRSYGDVISFPWSGTVPAGGNVTVDRSSDKVKTYKIVGLYYAYSGGIPGGCGINVSYPSDGTVRFFIYNNTGSPVTFSGGNLESKVMASVQEAVDYVGQMRDGHVGMSQITEDGMPFNKIEEIMRGTYNREKARRPSLTMDQWNQFYDYFAIINAYSCELDIDNKEFGISVCRESLASQAGARKMVFFHGDPNPPTFETSLYYTQNCWEYRHRGVNGYLGGMYGLKNGRRVYNMIFNIEKQYCALDTHQVLVYGTILGEGIDNRTERRGCWPRLPIPSPKGDMVRLQFNTFGFHLFENEAFLTLFLAEKYVVWDDNGLNGQDIRDWGPAFYGTTGDGNFDKEKTQWQGEGQGLVVWDNNNPSHPHPISTPGNIAAVVRVADNGIFTGAWIYDQIKNYCNQSRRYARHNYVDSTGAHSGYPWDLVALHVHHAGCPFVAATVEQAQAVARLQPTHLRMARRRSGQRDFALRHQRRIDEQSQAHALEFAPAPRHHAAPHNRLNPGSRP